MKFDWHVQVYTKPGMWILKSWHVTKQEADTAMVISKFKNSSMEYRVIRAK